MKTQLISAQFPQVNAFIALVSCDEELSARLKETNSDEEFYSTAAQLAQDLGFSFSAGDVQEYFYQKLEAEIPVVYAPENFDVIAGGIFIAGCPGLISTIICTPKSACWTNSLC